MLTQIASVNETERQCCRFLTSRVTVEADGGPNWLDVYGPAGTMEFLAGVFDLIGTSSASQPRRSPP